MSNRASTWAWAQNSIKGMTKFVLIRLADHANTEGHAYPGADNIAQACGISERTVSNAIKELTEKGLISWERRYGKDGNRTSNLYQLHLPGSNPLNNDSSPANASGEYSSGENASPENNSASPAPDASAYIGIEPSVEPSGSTYLHADPKTPLSLGDIFQVFNTRGVSYRITTHTKNIVNEFVMMRVNELHLVEAIGRALNSLQGSGSPITPAYLKPIVVEIINGKPKREGGGYGAHQQSRDTANDLLFSD